MQGCLTQYFYSMNGRIQCCHHKRRHSEIHGPTPASNRPDIVTTGGNLFILCMISVGRVKSGDYSNLYEAGVFSQVGALTVFCNTASHNKER